MVTACNKVIITDIGLTIIDTKQLLLYNIELVESEYLNKVIYTPEVQRRCANFPSYITKCS